MNYIDTKDELGGEQAALDALVSRRLTNFTDTHLVGIRNYAFYGYEQLTGVYLPKLKVIPEYSFYSTGLTTVDDDMFPSATSIERYAFYSCGNMEKIVIPSNCASIKANAFGNCHMLKEVIVPREDKIVSLSGYESFVTTPLSTHHGAVYVPDILYPRYMDNTYWKQYFLVKLSEYPIREFGSITDSWEDIAEAEIDGTYASKYSIGDTKTIYIDGQPINLKLIAIDADDLADGSGKAHLTWFTPYTRLKLPVNETRTNTGGWGTSYIRDYLRTLVNNFDSNLKSMIKPVSKTYYDYSTNSTKTIEDTAFLLSSRELNYGDSAKENSGVIYSDIFKDDNSRRMFYVWGSSAWWFTRTAATNSTHFYRVIDWGQLYTDPADEPNAIFFGFCT